MEAVVELVIKEGWNLVWKPATHFVFSGGVGLLVYWLTLTILLRSSGGIGTQKLATGESGMHRSSFCLALLFAIWFHLVQDFTLNWF